MTEIVESDKVDTKHLEILAKEFEKSEEEIEAGRIIDYSDFKEKLRVKYNF
ncbi:hypothetical protein [Flavobacterium aquidurense]|uniref:hypothetical protein n=1 Tax=Flavobacterium aquidurense TaxID=362413 RepID=UPI00285D40AE|nr:hypothetical protein [Flavobacterium aquidurense]MDR7371503.1 hypothetical protein [Flavobacterium aquidurense]